MTEQLAGFQQTAMGAHKDKPVSPVLYLSSVNAGWEGLVAEAFHEPME